MSSRVARRSFSGCPLQLLQFRSLFLDQTVIIVVDTNSRRPFLFIAPCCTLAIVATVAGPFLHPTGTGDTRGVKSLHRHTRGRGGNRVGECVRCGPTLDLEIFREVPNTGSHASLTPPQQAEEAAMSNGNAEQLHPLQNTWCIWEHKVSFWVCCLTAVSAARQFRPACTCGLPCPKRGLEGRGEGREDRFRGLSSRPVIPFFFC